jgi:AraC-like DNA-binding protein
LIERHTLQTITDCINLKYFTDLRLKLIHMGMPADIRPNKPTPALADWQALHPRLERCFEGPPEGKSGNFPGTVFTLCKLLQGSVGIEKSGYRIHSKSADQAWILSSPGTRMQHFSDDAIIISIHIALGNPGNGAEWTGPAVICVAPDKEAEAALAALCDAAAIKNLTIEQRLNLRSRALPLLDNLRIQSKCIELFHHALRLAEAHQMQFEVPSIHDPRVQSSHRKLAGMEMWQEYSRQDLAAKEGLTAGQLDRLWRVELGLTPSQYRDRQRLIYACEQLRQHDIPIKVIAADLGFRHLSQFSNWFYTRHSESPRSFRKRPGSS